MAKQSVLFKNIDVSMSMADIAEFAEALHAEWPTIRFVEYGYARHLYTYDVSARRDESAPGGWETSIELRFLVPRENWYLPLHYAPTVPRERIYWAWVLPSDDWVPEWAISERPLEPGRPIVLNWPRLQFCFHRSCFWSSRQRWLVDSPAAILEEDERIESRDGWLWGSYERDDKEQLAFLNKVLRIAKGMTSNKHAAVDRETGEIKQVVDKGGWHWSGRHLRAWAMAHPRHFICENLKPLPDKIDDGMAWTRS